MTGEKAWFSTGRLLLLYVLKVEILMMSLIQNSGTDLFDIYIYIYAPTIFLFFLLLGEFRTKYSIV